MIAFKDYGIQFYMGIIHLKKWRNGDILKLVK
jgi:hypothetical protein